MSSSDECLTTFDVFLQIGKCLYVSKKVEFGGMRCQVSGLWSQGGQVQSGAIVDNTRVSGCGLCAITFVRCVVTVAGTDVDTDVDVIVDRDVDVIVVIDCLPLGFCSFLHLYSD